MQSVFQNAINMKAEFIFIHQQDSLDDKELEAELRDYPLHIYLICRSPIVKLDDAKTVISEDKVDLTFYTTVNGQRKDIPISTVNNPARPVGKIECPYPHNIVIAHRPDGTWHSEAKANLLLRILAQQNQQNFEELDFEVLYVGQAFGENGKRITVDRLKKHEKAQRIYFDTQQRFPDYEVWFISMTFQPLLITMFKPWGDVDDSKFEEQLEHYNMVTETPMTFDQQVTVMEASLIKYFDTREYNKEYLNFPTRSHTDYDECYKLDFNSAGFEVTSKSIHGRLWSKSVAPTFFHYKQFFLHKDTDRKDMFKWFE